MELGTIDFGAIIKEQLRTYERNMGPIDTGTVIQVGDGIAKIHGLDACMSGELIEFPGEIYGLALNLEIDSISCVLLGDDRGIKEGDIVKKTGRIVEVPVGDDLIGRVVNSLGQPIDGKGRITSTKFRSIENMAPGINDRKSVNEPLQTGIKSIDAMFPIGKGQRELIIGDRQEKLLLQWIRL